MTYENITERQVLCFGDSNTYGYDPVRDGRYGPDERYPAGPLRRRACPAAPPCLMTPSPRG